MPGDVGGQGGARTPARRAAVFCAFLLVIGFGQGAASADSMIEQRALVETATGQLHGTLLRPAGDGPFPAALIIPGSGPTDRDGNGPGMRNDSLKLLAEALAGEGIGTLRIDKRGVGASAAAAVQESALRFETYVEDAAIWAGYLAELGWAERVVIIGHSEGALVGTLAAQRSALAGLVLIAGVGVPAGQLLQRQLDKAGLPEDLLRQAHAVIVELEAGRLVAQVDPRLQALLRPSVQPYLVSWFRYDPAVELSKLDRPVLVVQGTHDLQLTIDDAERLAAGQSSAELVLIDGMNHVLKPVSADTGDNIAAYNDPFLAMASGLAARLGAFIRQTGAE